MAYRTDARPPNADPAARLDRGLRGVKAAIEYPHGLFLNALNVSCSQDHVVTQLPLPPSRADRRKLESELGCKVWAGADHAYVTGELPGTGRSIVSLPCDNDPGLHLFLLRDAFHAHAGSVGFDGWFRFAGELYCVRLAGEVVQDGFRIQPVLRLRLLNEGFTPPVTVAVARHTTRWLLEQSLAETQMQQVAVSESAVRLSGDGPRRGQVMDFEGSNVVLLVKSEEVRVPAASYTLTANFAFIRRHYGAQVLRRLQVASGSLTATGQRNRFAVKHRFAALAVDLAAFGSVVELPGGGLATLEPEWLSVEVQSEA